MREYNPDVWVMLKFNYNGEVIYKILAGWYGGYTSGDSWKLNSGCTKVEKDGDFLLFSGSSGSVYRVPADPHGYRMSGLTSNIYLSFQKQIEDNGDSTITMEMMPADTNWTELDYGE